MTANTAVDIDALDLARKQVTDYHQRTRHHPGRYAAGPQGLDWDDQPDPFRYLGTWVNRLTTPDCGRLPVIAEVADGRIATAWPTDRETIGQLFGNALAISAWKRYRANRWSLRCNPSSGNLHPTEAYLFSTGAYDIPAGLQLYSPKDHALAERYSYTRACIDQLQRHTPRDGVLIGLSNTAWREAWKYGERAWRYCQLDLGHALATLRAALRDEFQWQSVEGCPAHVDLSLLLAARAERTAAGLACQQPIAGNSAFAVAMLAEFDAALEPGAPGYRELFREAGVVGQALHMEAEAIGLQGTGISCYFDDALHDQLGIGATRYQVMHQFTVGGAVMDTRIASEPAYPAS